MSEAQHFTAKVEYSLLLDKLYEEFISRFDGPSVPSSGIGLNNYTVKAMLGVGSFGKVLLVKEREGDNYHAAKMLNKDQIVKTKQVNHILTEKRVLFSMHFPNVIHLVASYKDADSLYLIMPLLSGGELFKYHRRIRRFTEKQARFYAAQVFLALEYLHYCGLLYRDLKPENIMLDTRGYIKLTDFGFAKRVETRTLTLCGTPEYLAPEIITSKPYGNSVDWWAFGVLIFEFVAGYSPFSHHKSITMSMYQKICEGSYHMPMAFSSSLKDLVENLLQVDLSRRFGNLKNGNKDIKNHTWFQGVDWIEMLNQSLNSPYLPKVIHPEDVSNFDRFPEYRPKPKPRIVRYEDTFIDF